MLLLILHSFCSSFACPIQLYFISHLSINVKIFWNEIFKSKHFFRMAYKKIASLIPIWYITKSMMCLFPRSSFVLKISHIKQCRLGWHTLHEMHQITPSKKYVIPIYKKLGFFNFQIFPASSFVSAAYAKNTKDFQNLDMKNMIYAKLIFIL